MVEWIEFDGYYPSAWALVQGLVMSATGVACFYLTQLPTIQASPEAYPLLGGLMIVNLLLGCGQLCLGSARLIRRVGRGHSLCLVRLKSGKQLVIDEATLIERLEGE